MNGMFQVNHGVSTRFKFEHLNSNTALKAARLLLVLVDYSNNMQVPNRLLNCREGCLIGIPGYTYMSVRVLNRENNQLALKAAQAERYKNSTIHSEDKG